MYSVLAIDKMYEGFPVTSEEDGEIIDNSSVVGLLVQVDVFSNAAWIVNIPLRYSDYPNLQAEYETSGAGGTTELIAAIDAEIAKIVSFHPNPADQQTNSDYSTLIQQSVVPSNSVNTTQLVDNAITPAKVDETGEYDVAGVKVSKNVGLTHTTETIEAITDEIQWAFQTVNNKKVLCIISEQGVLPLIEIPANAPPQLAEDTVSALQIVANSIDLTELAGGVFQVASSYGPSDGDTKTDLTLHSGKGSTNGDAGDIILKVVGTNSDGTVYIMNSAGLYAIATEEYVEALVYDLQALIETGSVSYKRTVYVSRSLAGLNDGDEAPALGEFQETGTIGKVKVRFSFYKNPGDKYLTLYCKSWEVSEVPA